MGEPFSQKKASFLHLKKWEQLNDRLVAGFTTRSGGLSKGQYNSLNMGLHVSDNQDTVINNRTILANHLNIPLENWVAGEQTHGTNIINVSQSDQGKGAERTSTALQETDGIITNEVGILNIAFFADCVPLYFFDPQSEYIGIAHAGWRGTVNNMAGKMIDKLVVKGVKRENLLIAIGPAISQNHYEVDDVIVKQIKTNNNQPNIIKQTNNNRYLLDLKQLNVHYLLKAGILKEQIAVTNYCTFKHHELFFSHRRDEGKTGRMLGFIGYRN